MVARKLLDPSLPGVHYPVDILCGLAIGAVVGVVVYLIYIRMYYRISPKIKYISTSIRVRVTTMMM